MVEPIIEQAQESAPAVVASAKKPIFGIFEGGGAKGIAHAGGYAAADELDFEFIGVAGASAGSIIAALIAVGYSPSEIFDANDPTKNIFATHQLRPVDVLGRAEWARLKRIRKHWFSIGGALALVLIITLLLVFCRSWLAPPFALVSAIGMAFAFIWGRSLIYSRGIFDPDKFASVFNMILRSRVEKIYRDAGQPTEHIADAIRFRDIDIEQVGRFCRLKVVATDISGQQLRLFDHRTPDVVIAEAVAASIAIPGIFKPAKIPSFKQNDTDVPLMRSYADGGLVSNLPVWCFAEEKAAFERRRGNSAAVPIVAFSLRDAVGAIASGSALSPFAYFAQVLRTAIFGGQTVVQDFVSDLCAVQLQCSLGVLAFDASWEDARNAYDTGKQQAFERLHSTLVIEPKEWERVLSTACSRIVAAIKESTGLTVELRLRASIFEPIHPRQHHPLTNDITAFHVTRSYNMERDADDRLTLDADSPGVPDAFKRADFTLWGPGDPKAPKPTMTKYERALVRRSVNSVICVPIFANIEEWNLPTTLRNQPLAVASFDTDEAIMEVLKDAQMLQSSITEATFGISALLTGATNE